MTCAAAQSPRQPLPARVGKYSTVPFVPYRTHRTDARPQLLAVERCIALKYALHVPVSDHGRKVEAYYPDFLPPTSAKRGGGLASVHGRHLSLNTCAAAYASTHHAPPLQVQVRARAAERCCLSNRRRRYEFSRFMTGRPTAAAGRAGSRCCTCYPYVMRIVARVVVLPLY